LFALIEPFIWECYAVSAGPRTGEKHLAMLDQRKRFELHRRLASAKPTNRPVQLALPDGTRRHIRDNRCVELMPRTPLCVRFGLHGDVGRCDISWPA
jgi:hypothetical protein